MASDFLDDVAIEVQKARAKFPNGRHLLPALMEEVGELANALLEQEYGHGVSSEDVYREAVQVATVAMRIAEEGEPVFPRYQPVPALDVNDELRAELATVTAERDRYRTGLETASHFAWSRPPIERQQNSPWNKLFALCQGFLKPHPDISDDPPTGEITAAAMDWSDADDPAVKPVPLEDRGEKHGNL